MASVAIPLDHVRGSMLTDRGNPPGVVRSPKSRGFHTTTDQQYHLINDFTDGGQFERSRHSITRPSLIRTNITEILLAGTLFLLPIALSIVLMNLIYAHLEFPSGGSRSVDTITEGDQTRDLNNREYYVDYSATRLVFISSLSSTLALALVPVGMALFAYMTGYSMQKASTSRDFSRLPSPYQFELTLRLLGGNFMDFYRYLQYIFRGKQRRVPAVRMLHHAALMLGALFALAILNTVVDAFLHIATSTVQYNRNTPYQDAEFNPGRRLPESCLDEKWATSSQACNIGLGGSGAKEYFLNSTEAYRIMGNASDHSTIRLTDDGITSVIVPFKSPAGVSYTGQSYASSTTCKTITKLCEPHYENEGGCNACQQWYYNCTVPKAGVQMSGLFNDNSKWTSSNIEQTFYSDASKAQNLSTGPQATVQGQMWTSLLFFLPQAEPNTTENLDGSTYYDANKDLISTTYGYVYGILSCNTTISDVSYYADTDGNIRDPILTPVNDTTGAAFVQALGQKFGDQNLENGLNIAEASALDSQDLAYRYARLLDRTTLGLTAGILPDKPANDMFRFSSKQVAKVPIPEFVALIALNLILAVLGIALCIQAYVLSKKQGVTDVQARLGLGALVAGMFEDEKLNESATSVEGLYAEHRGLPTDRLVAVDPRVGGGRMFVAVGEGKVASELRDVT